MKIFFFFAVFAATLFSVTQALQCHYCRYVEGDDTQAACRLDYDAAEYKIDCDSRTGANLTGPTYCAKWIGTVNDKEIIIRNCYSKNNGTGADDIELRENCNFGKDHIYQDNDDKIQNYYAGKLCLCADEFCNGAATLGLQASVLGFGVILLKFVY